ncbi:unnamed protein product [Symbiodinium sp. CCMP2456]|nr:unnamed protein product [Symbiodinium sp. CCMP2456]
MGSSGSAPDQGGDGRTSAEAEAQDRAGEEQPHTGELRVRVIFATSGETHSTVVLPAGALVSDLAKALDETSRVPGKCSSFLRDGEPLRMEDRLACSRGAVEEVTIQLVVYSLVGRWTWTKGERRELQEAHDYECHVLLLRSDGRAQFNQFHSWRKDSENYGSKRTMIGCKERGGPRDQLSSEFLCGEDLKDEGRGVWEVQHDPEPTLCVSGPGFVSAGIIEDDDLVAHGAGAIPHEVFVVTLRELLASFEFSKD